VRDDENTASVLGVWTNVSLASTVDAASILAATFTLPGAGGYSVYLQVVPGPAGLATSALVALWFEGAAREVFTVNSAAAAATLDRRVFLGARIVGARGRPEYAVAVDAVGLFCLPTTSTATVSPTTASPHTGSVSRSAVSPTTESPATWSPPKVRTARRESTATSRHLPPTPTPTDNKGNATDDESQ